MARAGSMNAPGPFNFRESRAPACAAESPKLSLPGAAPGRLASFSLGSWQTSNAPALQAGLCGSVTHRLHQFHRGENEIQVSLISFASVGATPTPATNFGRLSDCLPVNQVSQNKIGSDELERYQHFPPFWTRSSISGATRCLREG